ncbi:hypothetical protein ACNQS7_00085, partial [Mycobacterium sp. 23]
PAAAGWTPADLTALVNEWLGTGHRIPDNPARPIALLGSLLAWYTAHNTLSARPAALDEAREAQQRVTAQARARTAARERVDYAAARARGKAAATGPGRAAAFAALAAAQRAAAARRTATVASSAAASWPPLPSTDAGKLSAPLSRRCDGSGGNGHHVAFGSVASPSAKL